MSILQENNPKSPEYRDTSFVGRLHESGEVDIGEYLKLEAEVLGELESEGSNVAKEVVARFGIITTVVLRYTVSHKDPSDGFTFIDIEMAKIYDLSERMLQVLEGLSDGKLPNRDLLPELEDA